MSTAEHTAHGDEPAAGDELAGVVRELSDRIEALQADVRRLGGPGLPSAEPGWESEVDPAAVAPSHTWVGSIPTPVRRRPAVPRLLLEVLFLAAAAAAAAAAELDGAAIAAVMAGAWLLVALIEWAASRADRRRDVTLALEPLPPAEPRDADPAWFVPPVEHTLIEDRPDSPTAVTRLPPAPDATAAGLDATVERRPGD
jgi:hypothetical protein